MGLEQQEKKYGFTENWFSKGDIDDVIRELLHLDPEAYEVDYEGIATAAMSLLFEDRWAPAIVDVIEGDEYMIPKKEVNTN
jgi:hypothetical protein